MFLLFLYVLYNFVTVQDGGKTGAKTGVKLAYKQSFALIFPSDGHPMLLIRPKPGKKIPAVLNSYILFKERGTEILLLTKRIFRAVLHYKQANDSMNCTASHLFPERVSHPL